MATMSAPAMTSRFPAKLFFFLAFFTLTILGVWEKDARVFDPNSAIALHFAPVKWFLAVHGLFAAIAMLVAAFQFSNRMRARHLQLHRLIGYLYVASVFIACPFAILISSKLARTPSQFVANCMNSFGWIVTTAIALYCIINGNIVQHRRWMIRSYPWAMTFTFNRATHVFLPSTRAGHPGFEATLWLSSALAAFLPSIFLEWRAIFPPTADGVSTVGRRPETLY